jgi:Ca2+-binding EF-hand superfamily protein
MARKERRNLFDALDVDGNGYIGLAEIESGLQAQYGIYDMFDAKAVVARSYASAKRYVPSDVRSRPGRQHNFEKIGRREFRIFLQYLHGFVELWVLFEACDTSMDMSINLLEFTQAIPKLGEWGIKIEKGGEAKVFAEVDQDHSGAVSFSEFCAWAIGFKLDVGGLAAEEEETFKALARKSMRTCDVDWTILCIRLPDGNTSQSHAEQHSLFQ